MVDCEPDTWCIDVDSVRLSINDRTKAIVAVHLYGQMADMGALAELADRYGITVVEDAAQAHGASLSGKKAGSLGRIGCFSFYSNKIITTGEGGMLTTDDDRVAEKAAQLRDQAYEKSRRFMHRELGYN